MRDRRRILPDGDWIASLAGFSRPEPDRDEMADVEAENSWETPETELPAVLETMLNALAGRAKGDGETRPVTFTSLPCSADGTEAGC